MTGRSNMGRHDAVPQGPGLKPTTNVQNSCSHKTKRAWTLGCGLWLWLWWWLWWWWLWWWWVLWWWWLWVLWLFQTRLFYVCMSTPHED